MVELLIHLDEHRPCLPMPNNYCWLWISNFSATGTNTELPIWHHSLEKSTSHLVASQLHGSSPSWKGQPFTFTGLDTLSQVYVCLSRLQSLRQHHYQGLVECLNHRPENPHNRTSNEDTHFAVKVMCKGGHDCGNHWSFHILYHPECWNGLLLGNKRSFVIFTHSNGIFCHENARSREYWYAEQTEWSNDKERSRHKRLSVSWQISSFQISC